jgi:hypothetical protein
MARAAFFSPEQQATLVYLFFKSFFFSLNSFKLKAIQTPPPHHFRFIPPEKSLLLGCGSITQSPAESELRVSTAALAAPPPSSSPLCHEINLFADSLNYLLRVYLSHVGERKHACAIHTIFFIIVAARG